MCEKCRILFGVSGTLSAPTLIWLLVISLVNWIAICIADLRVSVGYQRVLLQAPMNSWVSTALKPQCRKLARSLAMKTSHINDDRTYHIWEIGTLFKLKRHPHKAQGAKLLTIVLPFELSVSNRLIIYDHDLAQKLIWRICRALSMTKPIDGQV